LKPTQRWFGSIARITKKVAVTFGIGGDQAIGESCTGRIRATSIRALSANTEANSEPRRKTIDSWEPKKPAGGGWGGVGEEGTEMKGANCMKKGTCNKRKRKRKWAKYA